MRPEQNNHKIIRAFFQLVREQRNVYYNDLKARCSNKENYHLTYMEKFKPNFDQMKIDAIKSNGKVFQINKGTEEVILWDFIEPRLMEYKHYFE